MDKIESFKINHKKLLPGIYISRKDKVNNEIVTTIDIRVKRPNFEDCMQPSVAHTIEHLGATYFRNLSGWKDDIIYFGPMGCLTGFYLVVAGNYEPSSSEYMKLVDMIIGMFHFVVDYRGQIPGCSPEECGNYRMMDIDNAKTLAANMLVLKETFDSLKYVYPNDENSQGIATSIALNKEVLPKTNIPTVESYEYDNLEDIEEVVVEKVDEVKKPNKTTKTKKKKSKIELDETLSIDIISVDSSTLKPIDNATLKSKVKKMKIVQNELF